jgi:hypothetical protein
MIYRPGNAQPRSHHPVQGCYCAICWPPRPQAGLGQPAVSQLARGMDRVFRVVEAAPSDAMLGALNRIQRRLG